VWTLTQCVTGKDGQNEPVTGSMENVRKVFQCMTRVLSQCPHFPDAVAKTILPVIDRYVNVININVYLENLTCTCILKLCLISNINSFRLVENG
jgi:hypothetical protein